MRQGFPRLSLKVSGRGVEGPYLEKKSFDLIGRAKPFEKSLVIAAQDNTFKAKAFTTARTRI
jgi:hypothetical protein